MVPAPYVDWLVTVSAADLEEVLEFAWNYLDLREDLDEDRSALKRLQAAVEASKPTFIRS